MTSQRKIKDWERGFENTLKARNARIKKKNEDRAKDEELSRLRKQIHQVLQENGILKAVIKSHNIQMPEYQNTVSIKIFQEKNAIFIEIF